MNNFQKRSCWLIGTLKLKEICLPPPAAWAVTSHCFPVNAHGTKRKSPRTEFPLKNLIKCFDKRSHCQSLLIFHNSALGSAKLQRQFGREVFFHDRSCSAIFLPNLCSSPKKLARPVSETPWSAQDERNLLRSRRWKVLFLSAAPSLRVPDTRRLEYRLPAEAASSQALFTWSQSRLLQQSIKSLQGSPQG